MHLCANTSRSLPWPLVQNHPPPPPKTKHTNTKGVIWWFMSQQKDCITVIFRNTETSNDCAKSSSATQWSFCSIALAYNMIGIQDSNYLYWRKGGFIRVSSRDNLDKNDENFVNKSKSYLKSRAHDQIIGRMIIRFIFFFYMLISRWIWWVYYRHENSRTTE